MRSSVASFKVLVAILAAGVLQGAHSACSVSINGGLPHPQPLILNPGGSLDVFGFKLPSSDGVLSFTPDEEVRLVCTGSSNAFSRLPSRPRDIRVRCVSGASFNHGGEVRNFDTLTCAEVPRSATRRSSTRCHNKRGRIVEIGFEVSSGEFFKVIEVCFDERKLNNIWSKFDLVSNIQGGENDFDPTDLTFTAGNFFPGVDPDYLYRKEIQKDTITRIIGRTQTDHFFNSTYYLTKGPLSDHLNFIYTSQKTSTMYYINSAPQWQNLKDGAWRIVEQRVRYHAHINGANLVVYTGTHGIATLPVVSKEPSEKELYLSIKTGSKQMVLPVPALFWKVVYEPVSRKGVVIVMVNNPHKNRTVLELDSARYNVCATKRQISSWYICTAVYQRAGFGYCCEVDDFRNFVTSLPPFEVTDILT